MKPVRVKVKMCGMTRVQDIAYAANLGVDAFGLIFYEQSPRSVTLQKARELCKDLPPFLTVVAVLVNPQQEFVAELIEELPINVLQFHGDETQEFCEQFNKPFIKTLHPKSSQQIQKTMQQYPKASAILLDTPSDISRGGTGESFEWSIIPKDAAKPYILAGGLNAHNVSTALRACTPYAVDICSGVEAEPGIKDPNKMSQLMKVVRDTQ